MNVVYLGIIEKIFNAIISPIIKFIGNLLGTVLGWVFEKILGPLLIVVFKEIVPVIVKLIWELLAGIFYSILTWFLYFIDIVMYAFDILIGVRNITYNGESFPLIELIFRDPGLRKIMALISIMGVALAAIFAIVAVLKSTFDFEFEGKRPIGKVLGATLRSFLTFAAVPVACFFFVSLSGKLIVAVNDHVFNGSQVSLGTEIMAICSFKAADEDFDAGKYAKLMNKKYGGEPLKIKVPINTGGDSAQSDGGSEKIEEYKYEDYAYESEYTTNPKMDAGPTKILRDASNAEKGSENWYFKFYNTEAMIGNIGTRGPFDVTKIDYLLGFVMGGFIVAVLCVILLTFTSRFFEVATLYLASPIFVAYIPLDDGEKFQNWKKKFVGRTMEGFGAVLSMRLFIIIFVPMIMSDNFKLPLGGINIFNVDEKYIEYVVKILFICGGIWAVRKTTATISYIFDWDTAQHESGISTAALAFADKASLTKATAKGASWAYGKIKSAKAEKDKKNAEQNQEFKGRALSAGAKNVVAPAESGGKKASPQANNANAGVRGNAAAERGNAAAERENKSQQSSKYDAFKTFKSPDGVKDPKGTAPTGRQIVNNSMFSVGYNKNGDAQLNKLDLGLFKLQRDENGDFRLAAVRAWPLCTLERNPNSGKVEATSVGSGLLYNAKRDENGNISERSAAFGLWKQDISRDSNGNENYNESRVLGGLLYRGETTTGADGAKEMYSSFALGLANVVARKDDEQSSMKVTGGGVVGNTWERLSDGELHATQIMGYQRAFGEDNENPGKLKLVASEIPFSGVIGNYNPPAPDNTVDNNNNNQPPQQDNPQQQQEQLFNMGNNNNQQPPQQQEQQFGVNNNQHQPPQQPQDNRDNQPLDNNNQQQQPQQERQNDNPQNPNNQNPPPPPQVP